ncbi:prepilin-type N-terminal cleavage/methylation domain-containing protein [Vibrio sp. AK197]
MRRTVDSGFTLVELIVVIILIGIVSVYAASRFFGVDSVSAPVAKEQIISVIRQVQLTRMQNNINELSSYCRDSAPASSAQRQQCLRSRLVIQPHCIGSAQACSLTDLSQRSDAVALSNLNFSTTPVLTEVDFDLFGNPQGSAGNGFTISIQGLDSRASVCVNPQGYVGGVCL